MGHLPSIDFILRLRLHHLSRHASPRRAFKLAGDLVGNHDRVDRNNRGEIFRVEAVLDRRKGFGCGGRRRGESGGEEPLDGG